MGNITFIPLFEACAVAKKRNKCFPIYPIEFFLNIQIFSKVKSQNEIAIGLLKAKMPIKGIFRIFCPCQSIFIK